MRLRHVSATLRDVATPLEELFAARLKAEMQERKVSANELSKAAKRRGFKLGQRSVSRMLELKQSPTLQKIYEISETLGLPAWFFLTEEKAVEQRVISPPNVVNLPPRYPKIFGEKPDQAPGKPKSFAKKRR